jgi:tRNA A58 N-methylase Trm61
MPHCKKTANPKMAHLVLRIPSSKKTLNKHSRLLENKSVIKNRTMELEQIKKSILEIRGKKVMLDMDLAIIYEVETRVLKQAFRRNIDRFPSDFFV